MANLRKPIAVENEILKASDVGFGYDVMVDNIATAMKSILTGTDDSFVVGGKVTPYESGGLNVSVAPLFAFERRSGNCVAETLKQSPVSLEPADSSTDRIDIVEIGITEEPYDTQTRAMYDPVSKTKDNFVQMETKKRVKTEVRVKKGANGSPSAPQVDEGFVKLAEVVVPVGTLNITSEFIRNITAKKSGAENSAWTVDKTATFNPGYISDICNDFLNSHNDDGSHKEKAIKASHIDFGTEANKVKGSVIPSGQSVSLHGVDYTAQESLTALIVALAANVNAFYPFANNIMSRFSFIDDLPVACSTENIDISHGGEKTIDGVTCTVGQMVFLKDQTDPKENGFWEVQTGAWNRYNGYRATNAGAFADKFITVAQGTENGGKIFYLEDDSKRIGIDELVFRPTIYAVNPTPNTIAMRDKQGRLKSTEPVAKNDVAVKKNIDDLQDALATHGDSIDGRNLLDVLGVSTVEQAFTVLHERCEAGNFKGLLLGDYIDLPSLTVSGTTYTHNDDYKNLRIVIAGFNYYKGAGDTENNKNHILWVFRNVVLKRQMNASDTNSGNYKASAMRTFLNGVFTAGLGAAIGANRLYTIKRALNAEWIEDTVFLPTTVEVFGIDTYGSNANAWNTNSQYPLYASGFFYRIKRFNGSRAWWWTATPYASNAALFCDVNSDGHSGHHHASDSGGGVAPAFCTC